MLFIVKYVVLAAMLAVIAFTVRLNDPVKTIGNTAGSVGVGGGVTGETIGVDQIPETCQPSLTL